MGKLAATRTQAGETNNKKKSRHSEHGWEIRGLRHATPSQFQMNNLNRNIIWCWRYQTLLPFYPLFVVMRPVRLSRHVWWLQFDAVAAAAATSKRKPFLKHHHHHRRKHWIFPTAFFFVFVVFFYFCCCGNNAHTGCSPLERYVE